MAEPSTYNQLYTQKFKFIVHRLPNVSFFATKANIPGMNGTAVNRGNPFVNIKEPGDHIEYDTFNVDFKVDENLTNYIEIVDWMEGINFPENWDQRKSLETSTPMSPKGLKSDLTLTILSSANRRIADVIIKDAFPTSLTEIPLSVEESTTATATVSFAFTNFEIKV